MYGFPSASFDSRPLPQGQRGAVLVIALIMLLILTLIGVAGLRDTQLQERMAGGAQDRELALQAAEAALRAAEAEVTDGNADDIDVGDNYKDYNVDDPDDLERKDSSNNPVTEAEYWRDHYVWIDTSSDTNSTAYTGTLEKVKTQPRYVIERLPNNYSAIAGSTNAGAAAATDVPSIRDFLITVRGTGATDESVVILQSQYRYVYVNP